MTEQSDPAKLPPNSRIDEVWEVIADFNLGVPRVDLENLDFKDLMQIRINKILLVSSLYDFYTLVEDGELTEAIFNEFLELNLHYAANIRRVNTGKAALEALAHEEFDLIISTQRLEDMNISAFAQAVRHSHPEIPVALLAYHSREFEILHDSGETSGFDGVFVWHGDTKLFLAIIKLFEDQRNAPHDCLGLSVRTIILVEDSPAFYSSYLPLIYAELIQQVQELIKEGKSFSDKLLRQRARPKILHATTFEQAMQYYQQYRSTLLGIITDMEYQKDGKIDEHAGLQLIEEVRKEDPELPILIQSATARPEDVLDIDAAFVHKQSRMLFQEVSDFIKNYFGFGDFTFRMPDGEEVARARNLNDMRNKLRGIPEESLQYHAKRNHFSNWLMARTHFALATKMKPVKVSHFESMEDLRQYLIRSIGETMAREKHGIIADYSREAYESEVGFMRIGKGSIGGKARGLAFVDNLLKKYLRPDFFPGVRISIPRTIVLGTDVFTQFMEMNDLLPYVMQNVPDESVVRAFMHGDFPVTVLGELREILEKVHFPLAVRSSSLLEDALYQPFAGVYSTMMIPNSSVDLDVRFRNLIQAIKYVYASTYFRGAKNYLEATNHRIEEEKMAVIIQEMVGSKHNKCFYPHMSGVVRSYNYYPFGKATPRDGVANLALGLGKTIVDGGTNLQFSPAHPKVYPQFGTTKDYFKNSQLDFYAVDLESDIVRKYPNEDQHLIQSGIGSAEEHGTLDYLASTFSHENDRLYEGIHREGPRVMDFGPILRSEAFPLARMLRLLTSMCETAMNCPVEIEFGIKLGEKKITPVDFSFLQVRPMVKQDLAQDVEWDHILDDDILLQTDMALGNGVSVIHDIVFVKPEEFDAMRTRNIAEELSVVNGELLKARKPYLLIGPGRWGSSDPSLGIPVQFPYISGASAIVETSLENMLADPSQGSHFFQNLTSFMISYFTLRHYNKNHQIDWDWLGYQQTVKETKYLVHINVPIGIELIVDGQTGKGVVLKRPRHVKEE